MQPQVYAPHARTVRLHHPCDEALALCRLAGGLQTLELKGIHDGEGERLQPWVQALAAGTWSQLQDLRVHTDELDVLPYLCADTCSMALTHLSCYVRRRTTAR